MESTKDDKDNMKKLTNGLAETFKKLSEETDPEQIIVLQKKADQIQSFVRTVQTMESVPQRSQLLAKMMTFMENSGISKQDGDKVKTWMETNVKQIEYEGKKVSIKRGTGIKSVFRQPSSDVSVLTVKCGQIYGLFPKICMDADDEIFAKHIEDRKTKDVTYTVKVLEDGYEPVYTDGKLAIGTDAPDELHLAARPKKGEEGVSKYVLEKTNVSIISKMWNEMMTIISDPGKYDFCFIKNGVSPYKLTEKVTINSFDYTHGLPGAPNRFMLRGLQKINKSAVISAGLLRKKQPFLDKEIPANVKTVSFAQQYGGEEAMNYATADAMSVVIVSIMHFSETLREERKKNFLKQQEQQGYVDNVAGKAMAKHFFENNVASMDQMGKQGLLADINMLTSFAFKEIASGKSLEDYQKVPFFRLKSNPAMVADQSKGYLFDARVFSVKPQKEEAKK